MEVALQMLQRSSPGYLKFRWLENFHIVLWLIKDTCWALEFRSGGIIMIVPTVAVAFYLLWRSRHYRQEAVHNLAVCIWIVANASWMLGEFYGHDLRPVAVGLFATGLTILLVWYLSWFINRRSQGFRKRKERSRSGLVRNKLEPYDR